MRFTTTLISNNISADKDASPELHPGPAGLDLGCRGGGWAARDQHRRRLVALVVHLDALPEAERGRRHGPRHLRRRQADQGQVLHKPQAAGKVNLTEREREVARIPRPSQGDR